MAEILKIEDNKVKIGTDDGKIVTVPIVSIAYPDPQEGDRVNVYKDEKTYIVKKVATSYYSNNPKGSKSINKHIFVWVANFLLGGLGVDRFLRGQVALGISKLLLGWLTLGIWPFVDWIISIVKAYGSAYGDVEDITFDKFGDYIK